MGAPSSSGSDNKNSSAAENFNHQNELFIGGSSLKLREGVFQHTSTMDLFQKKTLRVKNNNIACNDAGTDSMIGEAGGMMMMDIHERESGGGGGGGGDTTVRIGGSRRGTAHTPWGRRGYNFSGSRPPSLLERSLLAGLSKNVRLPFPSSREQAETAQMTIFYAGNVNVYDNVPADKAYAVMVLANQCCVAPVDPIVQDATTKLDLSAKTIPPSSLDNSTTGVIPLARQQLRRFLEKRRDRMLNKFPYAKLDDKLNMENI